MSRARSTRLAVTGLLVGVGLALSCGDDEPGSTPSAANPDGGGAAGTGGVGGSGGDAGAGFAAMGGSIPIPVGQPWDPDPTLDPNAGPDDTEWIDSPGLFQVNRAAAHATLMPHQDLAAALNGDRTASPYYLSLAGIWKFHLVDSPADRLPG